MMDKKNLNNSEKPEPQIVTPDKNDPRSDKNSSHAELKQRGQMPKHDEEIGGG